MVYASSSSVYGGNKSLPFRVEDRVDHPLSLYAATKKADELLSESYASLYRLPLTGLRFFTVYGPWGRPDMAMWIFTKALFAGEPLPLFNGGEMRRDFTYIDDIVRGVVACLDGPPADDGAVKAGGSTSAARDLQYRQQPQRRSDARRRAARAGDRHARRCSTRSRCSPATSRRPSPTSARSSATTASSRRPASTKAFRASSPGTATITALMSLPPILQRLRIPVIGAPMFIVSNPKLVIAQCTAGIVGSFPALNARPAEQLDEWLHEITEALAAWDRDHPERPAAPFAVNQIVHRSNDRFEHDMAVCAKWKVPIVITSLGARVELNEAVHGWGGITLHDIIDDRFARKAIEKGADGVIAVAAGAGGHAGRWSPFALVQEIRAWFDGPLILSGAIANGGVVLAAQAPGADLAYVGSPFIATEEANAPDAYKQAIVDSGAADIVYSDLFTGVHGNYLRSSIVNAGLDPDKLAAGNLDTMKFGSEGSSKSKAWRDIWGSGQGIGAVDRVAPGGRICRPARRAICRRQGAALR